MLIEVVLLISLSLMAMVPIFYDWMPPSCFVFILRQGLM